MTKNNVVAKDGRLPLYKRPRKLIAKVIDKHVVVNGEKIVSGTNEKYLFAVAKEINKKQKCTMLSAPDQEKLESIKWRGSK